MIKVREAMFVAILGALFSGPSVRAESDNTSRLREDAIVLMGASLVVPGVAAYCEKFIGPNADRMAAAASWNKRHDADMRLVIRVIEETGGMTKSLRERFDKTAFRMVKWMVEADNNAICTDLEEVVSAGVLDLAKREDTAPALRRLKAHFQ